MQQRIVALTAVLLILLLSKQSLLAQRRAAQAEEILHILVDPSRTGVNIREDFIGLSYDKVILTHPRVFTPENAILRTLLENLGKGNLRVGAASVETTGWTRQQRTPSTGEKTITADDLDRFYAFVKATGWNVVHALNWRNSNPTLAADEAAYAASVGGNSIVGFEIGNEPDLAFVRGENNTVEDYINEFRSFAAAIRQRVPDAHFVGPGATYWPRSDDLRFLTRGVDEWAVPFVDALGGEIVQLTQHIYVVGKPKFTEPDETYEATIPALLSSASRDRYIGVLKKLANTAERNRIPYRINESNSCYHQGMPGVSDTFASALWGADYLFTLASYGASGVNFQSGAEDFIYTPIDTRESEKTNARPLYYALLFFHAAGAGHLIPAIAIGAENLAVNSYGVLGEDGSISVAIINREFTKNVTVQLDVTRYFDTGKVLRLEAPSLSSTTGVRFAGASVGQDGTWVPTSKEMVSREGQVFGIQVPAASAAVIRFEAPKCRWPGCSQKAK